jgi:hypothetical protein
MKIDTNYTLTSNVDSVEEQQASIDWNGKVAHYNIASLLGFKENLENAIADHAATQSYWEQLAIEFQSQAQKFENEGYARWWAHARRYARLVMRALQVSETLESLRDWVITIYSADTSTEELDGYVETGYRGWLLERHGTLHKVDVFLKKQEEAGSPKPDFGAFKSMMLSYALTGWTYEKVVSSLRDLKDQAAKVQSVARSLNNAAFNMKAYKDLQTAKFGNVDPKLTSSNPQQLTPTKPISPFKTSRSGA